MAVSTAPLLNGERAVVILLIANVLFSLPFSLLYHGLSLSILSLCAFFIEIRAETSSSVSQFKTRAGASSGILLGAVTLPIVMLSKLIQLSRAVSTKEAGLLEIETWTMYYWASVTSCLGVLMLLWIVMRETGNSQASSSWKVLEEKLGVSCVILSAAMCHASLVGMSLTGFHTALKFLWTLCHGFAAVKLIQHLLCTFPACASIGEALLVTAGLVLYVGDIIACTIAKVYGLITSSDSVSVQYGMQRNEICVIIQGLLLGLLLSLAVFKFLLRTWESNSSSAFSVARKYHDTGRSIIFFGSLGFILVGVIPFWMEFVKDFHMHPLLWVVSFVFSEPLKRLSLCIYWVALICVSVLRFYNISKNSKIERILLRKYYHLLAVLMFVPALIFQPTFLDLAFGAALAAFAALEIIRIWRIWPLGQLVHQFMNAFTDHRDSDLLIVSHFSLLLGSALPIWMSSGYNDRPLAPFAGILSLGIGDTMASVVGHKYGVLRWSKTGKKTIEGTAAGITSVLAACSVLLPLLASTGYILTEHWLSLLIAVTISGLLEAYTAQLDNAFIPLVFYSLLCL